MYVSDIRDLERQLHWRPKISPRRGVEMLYLWVLRNRAEIESLVGPPAAVKVLRAG